MNRKECGLVDAEWPKRTESIDQNKDRERPETSKN